MSQPGKRIPSLDGLRAVSISLVLFDHLAGDAGFPIPPGRFVGPLGTLGVRVFFVISGFLITSLLLGEESRTGSISLRHFYLRRTLRISPPFYVYAGIITAFAALGWLTLRPFDVLAAFTYTTNFHQDRGWYLGHAWSLAVEEQFYLLWPFVFRFFRSTRASRVALGVMIVCPLLRLGLMIAAPTFRPGIGETFPTVADTIATGCLLACLRSQIDASPRFLAFLSGKTFWFVPALALAAAFEWSAKLDCLVGQTVANVGIALLIARMVRFPSTLSGRFLNARPVIFVGVLSYSLYLWQQPFLNRHGTHALSHFPLNLVLAFSAALASYALIERPALRLRARIEKWIPRAPTTNKADQPASP